MAQYVFPYAATIPAGTPQSSPVTIPIGFQNYTLERLDLEVPPGPSGLMGFQVFNNGVAWIPNGTGNWIVWNNVKDSYYLTDQPNASGWAIVGYNLGVYNHTVTTRWHCNPTTVAQATGVTPAVTFVTSDTPAAELVTLS